MWGLMEVVDPSYGWKHRDGMKRIVSGGLQVLTISLGVSSLGHRRREEIPAIFSAWEIII